MFVIRNESMSLVLEGGRQCLTKQNEEVSCHCVLVMLQISWWRFQVYRSIWGTRHRHGWCLLNHLPLFYRFIWSDTTTGNVQRRQVLSQKGGKSAALPAIEKPLVSLFLVVASLLPVFYCRMGYSRLMNNFKKAWPLALDNAVTKHDNMRQWAETLNF